MTATGTYSGVKFDTDTKRLLHQYMGVARLPNMIRPDKLHTTILYSRKHLPSYVAAGIISPPWIAKIIGLEVFLGRPAGAVIPRCLVVKLECKELSDRHQLLMDTYEATYDFPDYQPHITISYDLGEIDFALLPRIQDTIETVTIVEEYGMDLEIEWGKYDGTTITRK